MYEQPWHHDFNAINGLRGWWTWSITILTVEAFDWISQLGVLAIVQVKLPALSFEACSPLQKLRFAANCWYLERPICNSVFLFDTVPEPRLTTCRIGKLDKGTKAPMAAESAKNLVAMIEGFGKMDVADDAGGRWMGWSTSFARSTMHLRKTFRDMEGEGKHGQLRSLNAEPIICKPKSSNKPRSWENCAPNSWLIWQAASNLTGWSKLVCQIRCWAGAAVCILWLTSALVRGTHCRTLACLLQGMPCVRSSRHGMAGTPGPLKTHKKLLCLCTNMMSQHSGWPATKGLPGPSRSNDPGAAKCKIMSWGLFDQMAQTSVAFASMGSCAI